MVALFLAAGTVGLGVGDATLGGMSGLFTGVEDVDFGLTA
jgi:hypothetical protein